MQGTINMGTLLINGGAIIPSSRGGTIKPMPMQAANLPAQREKNVDLKVMMAKMGEHIT